MAFYIILNKFIFVLQCCTTLCYNTALLYRRKHHSHFKYCIAIQLMFLLHNLYYCIILYSITTLLFFTLLNAIQTNTALYSYNRLPLSCYFAMQYTLYRIFVLLSMLFFELSPSHSVSTAVNGFVLPFVHCIVGQWCKSQYRLKSVPLNLFHFLWISLFWLQVVLTKCAWKDWQCWAQDEQWHAVCNDLKWKRNIEVTRGGRGALGHLFNQKKLFI